jgi:hypothetical protein
MKFNRITEYAELSECGRYTVAGARVSDRLKFQAWRREPGKVASLLDTFDDAESAREACRRDAIAREAT